MVRIWNESSQPATSISRPTCQVSTSAPARCQAAAVSSSQLVPGALKTIARGLAMIALSRPRPPLRIEAGRAPVRTSMSSGVLSSIRESGQ